MGYEYGYEIITSIPTPNMDRSRHLKYLEFFYNLIKKLLLLVNFILEFLHNLIFFLDDFCRHVRYNKFIDIKVVKNKCLTINLFFLKLNF